MSKTIAWLANPSAQPLSLLQATLNALDSLRGPAGTISWSDALKTLTSAVAANQQPAAVPQDEWVAVKNELHALRASLDDKLPSWLEQLTRKLADLSTSKVAPSNTPGLLTYPLVSGERNAAGQQTVGGLGFLTSVSASGAASATIAADAQAPAWATSLGYRLPDDQCFFRIGVQGSLDGSGAATASPAWGKVSGKANLNGSAYLEYCFHYREDDYVAEALAESLQDLPAPGQLDRMLTLCKDGDFAVANLDVKGELSIKGDVAAGKALVLTQAGPNAALQVGLGIEAGLAADWSLSGDYRLTVQPTDNGALVRLARQVDNSNGVGISLSAKIGIDGAQAVLDPLMQQALPTAQALIERLGKLSDLRQLALDAACDALGLSAGRKWDNVVQKLLDLASGGGQAAQAALGKELSAILSGATSGYLEKGTQALNEAIDKAGARIVATLPPAAVKTQLTQALDNWKTKAQQGVDNAIATFADQLKKAGDSAAADIASALQDNHLQTFIADLQSGVNQATAKLGAWLNSYQKARQRVADQIGQIQQRKLALDLAYNYRDTEGRGTLYKIRFIKPTSHASALYRALWSGQLEQYAELIKACKEEDSAVEEYNLFSLTRERASSFGFGLNVFGLLNVNATVATLENIVVTRENGNITVASDTNTLNSILKVNGATSKTALTFDLSLLTLRDTAPPLRAEFSASSDDLEPKQLDDFFRLLEETRAVSGGTGNRVKNFLFAGTAGTSNLVAQAEISGSLSLSLEEWQRLLSVKAADVINAVRAACFDTLTAAVKVGADGDGSGSGSLPQAWIAHWCDYSTVLKNDATFWSLASSTSASWKGFASRIFDTPEDYVPRVMGTYGKWPAPLSTQIKRLWEIQQIADGAGKAWLALQAESALLQSVFAQTGNGNPESLYKQLSALSKTVSKELMDAFVYNIPDPGQPIKVSWRFLGLVLGLHRLAAPGERPNFVVQVSSTDHGEPVASLFL